MGNMGLALEMTTKQKIPNTVVSAKPAKRSAALATPKKVGRPRAKHSDPNYAQMSICISRDVRSKVKMRLLEADGEFSGLVEFTVEGVAEDTVMLIEALAVRL